MRYVIGDIHGHAQALRAILATINVTAADHLIVMGDLIDHGPDSKGVLDLLMRLQHKTQLTLLRGNHECLLLASRDDSDIEQEWLRYGGNTTLNSFNVNRAAEIPATYVGFLEQAIPLFEMDDAIFVHAGVDPEKNIDEQTEDDLFWRHLTHPVALASGKTLVTAHTPRKTPYLSPEFIAVDTGMGQGDWLSCIALNDSGIKIKATANHYLLANAQGEIRITENVADNIAIPFAA